MKGLVGFSKDTSDSAKGFQVINLYGRQSHFFLLYPTSQPKHLGITWKLNVYLRIGKNRQQRRRENKSQSNISQFRFEPRDKWKWSNTGKGHLPDEPFNNIQASISGEIGEFYIVQKRRATDFEATKVWKGSSGSVLGSNLSGKQRFVSIPTDPNYIKFEGWRGVYMR